MTDADDWLTPAEAIACIIFQTNGFADEVRGKGGVELDTTLSYLAAVTGQKVIATAEACAIIANKCLSGAIRAKGIPSDLRKERIIAAREWIGLVVTTHTADGSLEYQPRFSRRRNVTRNILGFDYPLFSKFDTKKEFSNTNSQDSALYSTGKPGRPGSWHIYEVEFERRWQAGERHGSLAVWSRVLREWLSNSPHQGKVHPMKPPSIANALRNRFNELKAQESSDRTP